MTDQPPAPVPPLRALDCTVARRGGQPVVRFQDPLGISPAAEVSMGLLAIAQLFDGIRTVEDIQAEIARQAGQIIPGDQLRKLVGDLDQGFFLDSPRFRERLRALVEEWASSPLRPPANAGGPSYPEEGKALAEALEGLRRRPGSVEPSKLRSEKPLRALFAPHIDFERGGHVYTWAYHEAGRRIPAVRGSRNAAPAGDGDRGPVYVVLGTCHQAMEGSFSATRKSYGTPLGAAETDGTFIDRLERGYGGDLRGDELAHRSEHSIEFQAVFLRHVLGDRPFTMVPILVAGFHEAVLQGVPPASEPGTARFLDALAAAVEETRREEGRETVLVGGVDLAHVGQHFGDTEPLTDRFLAEVRTRDRALLEAAAAVEPEAFFEEIARDGNRRRVCGVGPMYAILCVLERLGAAGGPAVRGELLAYDQAVDRRADLCVSFASMAFEDR